MCSFDVGMSGNSLTATEVILLRKLGKNEVKETVSIGRNLLTATKTITTYN
ncbi:hypothetical protein AGMMS50262_06070 [Bacteroidia bacterium]|nr:hypothetical protein AGMMS50262_06070 [Bacteroidia bacterium]